MPQCHFLRLAARQKADCVGVDESHILDVKSNLRVAALPLPAQSPEILLSRPAAAGPDGFKCAAIFPGIESVFARRPQHVERWRTACAAVHWELAQRARLPQSPSCTVDGNLLL